MAIPRMRGLKEAVDELHAEDENCQLTLYALRMFVASGDIPCVRVGRRVLINMELLYDFLNRSPVVTTEAVAPGRNVRRIN